jgi:hypothetical protein
VVVRIVEPEWVGTVTDIPTVEFSGHLTGYREIEYSRLLSYRLEGAFKKRVCGSHSETPLGGACSRSTNASRAVSDAPDGTAYVPCRRISELIWIE